MLYTCFVFTGLDLNSVNHELRLKLQTSVQLKLIDSTQPDTFGEADLNK